MEGVLLSVSSGNSVVCVVWKVELGAGLLAKLIVVLIAGVFVADCVDVVL